MKSHQRSVSCWIILLAAGVCAQAYVADAGIVLTVRDTISGIGGDSLVAVADLDHDGIRDVVTRNAGGFTIYEQTGATSAVRFSAGFVMRGAVANDIDGDGNIEILVSPPDTATVYRATGNDTYSPIYSATGGYGIIGGLMSVGDVNGNGNKEFLIPSKSNGLYALESQGGDAFSVIAASNNPVEIAAPTADLDGDGQPEIVAGGDNSVNTYVYHLVGGSLQTVFHSATDGLLGVGDTDGDGRAEIITRHNGFDTLGSLVSDGMGGYVVAAEVALPGQAF
ncbi:MAG: VCBS repeat-containing protein, partial [Planctomycetota bacterium]|nr:VCBS repeat-containing protein [Planctomycetota bacterium]